MAHVFLILIYQSHNPEMPNDGDDTSNASRQGVRFVASWPLTSDSIVIFPCGIGLCLATALLVLYIAGLVRARSLGRIASVGRAGRYTERSLWYMLWKEKFYLILPIWAAQTVASVRVFYVFCIQSPFRIRDSSSSRNFM